MFKKIIMFSGATFIVEEEEADKIADSYNSECLIGLRSGDKINPRGIESIQDYIIEKWGGYEVYREKSGRKYFIRDSEKVYLGSNELKEIKIIKIEDKKLLT